MERPPWLARVEVADSGYTGCGLLVGSRLVITWSRVLHGQTSARVTLSDGAGPRPAQVVGTGEMAVLELDAPTNHPPARFAPYHALHVYDGQKLAVGIRPALGSPVCRAEWYTGESTARLILESAAQLDENEVLGAAVYNPRTRLVVGMVSDALAKQMVPTDALADLWDPVKEYIDFGPFGADAYQELLRILRPLRLESLALQRFRTAVEMNHPLPGAASSVAGLAEALVIESPGEPGETSAAMARFMRLAYELPGAPVADLHAWANRYVWHVELPEPEEARQAIVVQLAPTAGDDLETFELHVWTAELNGDLDVAVVAKGGLPREQVRAEVEQALFKAVAGIPQSVEIAFIEFVLAGDWLIEPVEAWHALFDDNTPLGYSKPITVRDLDRVGANLGEQQRRVLKIRTDPHGLGQIMQWRDCDDPPSSETAFKAWLRRSDPPVGLGLTGDWAHPDRITTAARSGVPVMLWSRTPCSESAHAAPAACAGARFHAEISKELFDATFDDVADRVKDLRIEAITQAGDQHCGSGVVLLRDDCRRRPMPLEFPAS